MESFIERLEDKEGELGIGGTRGAGFEDERLPDELPGNMPVGEVGDAEFGGPGLFVPPFLPLLNLPLLLVISVSQASDGRLMVMKGGWQIYGEKR